MSSTKKKEFIPMKFSEIQKLMSEEKIKPAAASNKPKFIPITAKEIAERESKFKKESVKKEYTYPTNVQEKFSRKKLFDTKPKTDKFSPAPTNIKREFMKREPNLADISGMEPMDHDDVKSWIPNVPVVTIKAEDDFEENEKKCGVKYNLDQKPLGELLDILECQIKLQREDLKEFLCKNEENNKKIDRTLEVIKIKIKANKENFTPGRNPNNSSNYLRMMAIKNAVTRYDQLRGDCPVLKAVKSEMDPQFATPKTLLSKKLQQQCQLLDDTPAPKKYKN